MHTKSKNGNQKGLADSKAPEKTKTRTGVLLVGENNYGTSGRNCAEKKKAHTEKVV